MQLLRGLGGEGRGQQQGICPRGRGLLRGFAVTCFTQRRKSEPRDENVILETENKPKQKNLIRIKLVAKPGRAAPCKWLEDTVLCLLTLLGDPVRTDGSLET